MIHSHNSGLLYVEIIYLYDEIYYTEWRRNNERGT